ncbi:MAG: hypothetical protein IJ231_08120 [Clostridia bacterium]|nr:hypothetical protein [Clostridia bacterium]
MRCSCKVCGPEYWMVQAESAALGCVCPVCGYRCADCLGTDTVVPRSQVSALAADPRFSPERLLRLFENPGAEAEADEEADPFGDEPWTRDGGF